MNNRQKQTIASVVFLATLGLPAFDTAALSADTLGGTDHWVVVTRDGITRTVRMVERQALTTEPRGSVMLLTGGLGQADYYEDGNEWRQWIVERLTDRDLDVWTISYPDQAKGWAEGAQGLGYRGALEIMEDICAYVVENGRGPKLAAQGNSGGALHILYGLQVEVCQLEIAVDTGTPVTQHRALHNESEKHCWGHKRTDYLLDLDDGDCAGNTLDEAEWEALDQDSLMGESLEDLGTVVIVNSDANARDTGHGWWLFRELSVSGKALLHIAGSEHDVGTTQEGAQTIVELLDGCIEGC